MTQTNTTQNKEELSKEVKKFRERYEDFIGIKKGEHIFKIHSDYFDAIAPFWLELLSQAHQSGIEERDRAIYGILAVIENQLQDTSFGEDPIEIVETVLTVIRQEMDKPHKQLLKKLEEAPDV